MKKTLLLLFLAVMMASTACNNNDNKPAETKDEAAGEVQNNDNEQAATKQDLAESNTENDADDIQAEGAIKFEYNWIKGDVFKIMHSSMIEKVTFGGEKRIDELTSSGMGFTFVVKDVLPDGSAWLNITYDRMLMNMIGPMGKMEFDTQNPPDTIPEFFEGTVALIGQSYDMLIQKDGSIMKFKGLDQLQKSILSKLKNKDQEFMQRSQESLNAQFNPEILTISNENQLKYFPDKSIAPGGSWSLAQDRYMDEMQLKVNYNFVYDSTAKGKHFCTVSGRTKNLPDPRLAQNNVSLESSGQVKGVRQINAKTGWLDYGLTEYSIESHVTVPPNEQLPDGKLRIMQRLSDEFRLIKK